ncbi:hypothetical protein EYF80_017759 [Liparis tanakae]|uniref:Uncharacterized protein n=1 Tax=Liparis tanakae TaxID=230148 RepID=A0A4Z2I2G8_9TELE|nr:hypothetical protein EYF80_017759 [Liparis tanakae]
MAMTSRSPQTRLPTVAAVMTLRGRMTVQLSSSVPSLQSTWPSQRQLSNTHLQTGQRAACHRGVTKERDSAPREVSAGRIIDHTGLPAKWLDGTARCPATPQVNWFRPHPLQASSSFPVSGQSHFPSQRCSWVKQPPAAPPQRPSHGGQ